MKKILRIALFALAFLLLAGVGTYVWASFRTGGLLTRTVETHDASFPVPFPLTPSERAALAPGEDPDAVALERAVERGRHLIESRYACVGCHGEDLGGGVMLEDFAIGRILGPNLTTGAGSRTLAYDASDWDRAVRHGVKPDGTRSVMPSIEFERMSDQELSDVIAYIRSCPPVDAEVPAVRLGPLGRILTATVGTFSADEIDHSAAHVPLPPAATVSADFGRHLAGVCVGCHRQNLAGGPIVGGDPSWPEAANLTPHVDGLAGWTLADFRRVLVEARRPDGTGVRPPMSDIVPFAENMTDVEIEALWAYLQSLPATATGQ